MRWFRKQGEAPRLLSLSPLRSESTGAERTPENYLDSGSKPHVRHRSRIGKKFLSLSRLQRHFINNSGQISRPIVSDTRRLDIIGASSTEFEENNEAVPGQQLARPYYKHGLHTKTKLKSYFKEQKKLTLQINTKKNKPIKNKNKNKTYITNLRFVLLRICGRK